MQSKYYSIGQPQKRGLLTLVWFHRKLIVKGFLGSLKTQEPCGPLYHKYVTYPTDNKIVNRCVDYLVYAFWGLRPQKTLLGLRNFNKLARIVKKQLHKLLGISLAE